MIMIQISILRIADTIKEVKDLVIIDIVVQGYIYIYIYIYNC